MKIKTCVSCYSADQSIILFLPLFNQEMKKWF